LYVGAPPIVHPRVDRLSVRCRSGCAHRHARRGPRPGGDRSPIRR